MFNKRKVLLTATCLALALTLGACDDNAAKEARYIKRGNALFEQGKYKQARIEYKNAASKAPTAAEPFYRLGLVAEAEGDLRNAFAGYLTAEQQDPTYAPGTLKVAQYYLGAEMLEETRKRINGVLSLHPDNAEAHALLASVLLRESKFDEAEKEGIQALALDRQNISAYAALSGIYITQKQYDKAASILHQGMESNPKDVSLATLVVSLNEIKKDAKGTTAAYQALFKLRPLEPLYRLQFAKALIDQGQIDEAEQAMREAIAAIPDSPDLKQEFIHFIDKYRGLAAAEAETKKLATLNNQDQSPYFWLADIFVQHGNADQAANLLSQIIDASNNPQTVLDARSLLARLNLTQGQIDAARKLVALVLDKDPHNRSALLVRANMSFDAEDLQGAVSDLRTVLNEKPNDPMATALLGESYLKQGRYDLATDTFRRLSDLDPLNFAARVRLAQVLNASGDNRQAMQVITQVTQVAPDYPVAWESAARIAIDGKNWLLAEQAIKTLEKMPGNESLAAFLRGLQAANTGNNDKALSLFKQVITADPTSSLAFYALPGLMEAGQKEGRMADVAAFLAPLKGTTPELTLALGKAYMSIGNDTAAQEAFDQALAATTTQNEIYFDSALFALHKGDRIRAYKILEEERKRPNQDLRCALLLAQLYTEDDKTGAAISLYEAILAKNDSLDAAANNYAQLVADYASDDAAKLDKARQYAEKFAGSSNPDLLDTLAWVYFKQGKNALALTIMQRAMAGNNALTAQHHYHYGAILAKNGNADQARTEISKALADKESYPGRKDAEHLADELARTSK